MIQRAIEQLHVFLKQKMKDLRQAEGLLRRMGDLNHRQIALLSHALRHPSAVYTIRTHRNSHGVVYQTARVDLLDLVDRGLLTQAKRGRSFVFFPPEDLGDRVATG